MNLSRSWIPRYPGDGLEIAAVKDQQVAFMVGWMAAPDGNLETGS